MSDLPPPSLPAGWYPDPGDNSKERYWDGNAWTTMTKFYKAAAPSDLPIPRTDDGRANVKRPNTPKKDERFLLGIGCLGWTGIGLGIAVLIVLVAALSGGLKSSPGIQACNDARNARSISDSANNEHDREVAAMEYAVKKEECESQGGTVP